VKGDVARSMFFHPTPVVGVFLERLGVVPDFLVVEGGAESERGLQGERGVRRDRHVRGERREER